MGPASRTVRTGISAEVHALAFVAPPPVSLIVVRRPDRACVLYIIRESLKNAERHVDRLLIAAVAPFAPSFYPSGARDGVSGRFLNFVRHGVLEISQRRGRWFAATCSGVRANCIV